MTLLRSLLQPYEQEWFGDQKLISGQLLGEFAQRLFSSESDMVAGAGGTYAAATPITATQSHFGTVATAGDSAILPLAIPGSEFTIMNNTGNAMTIWAQNYNPNFGGAKDQILVLASPTVSYSVTLPSNYMGTFRCFQLGQWNRNF